MRLVRSRAAVLARSRATAPVAVGLVAAAALAIALFAPGRRGWFDVGVYWGTAQWWRQGGSIYSYLHPGTPYGFTYPPFALLCMLPLSVLTWPAAVVAMLAVNVACLVTLLRWLVEPVIVRTGWPRWPALVVAGSLLAVFGPARDTVSFGQVNLVLLVLVWADLRRLTAPRPSAGWSVGAGIGLAAAVKLTPLLFIGYLLLTRQWRAARTATGTFLAATGAAVLVAPNDSLRYWTQALWQTNRVGDLGYVSNQSLRGLVARLDPTDLPDGGHWLWPLAVLVVLGCWAAMIGRGRLSHHAGFAATGVTACLVSPVSWVHHLVWLLPALLLVLDAGLRTGRRWPLALCAAGYLALSTGLVWIAATAHLPRPLQLLGSDAGVLTCLALLAALPLLAADEPAQPAPSPVAGRYAARS
jgi:alpha-1,2-mannosyltransferase